MDGICRICGDISHNYDCIINTWRNPISRIDSLEDALLKAKAMLESVGLPTNWIEDVLNE